MIEKQPKGIQIMLFGTEVILTRGSRGRKTGPGHEREIRAKYIGAHGHLVICKLLEDDPNGVVSPFKCGETGFWERSAIRPLESKNSSFNNAINDKHLP